MTIPSPPPPLHVRILSELRQHAPFTLFGAMTGILVMMIFRTMSREAAHGVFYILHPAHVVLSAMVTTALYCRYKPKSRSEPGRKWWKVLLVGYVGSIGVTTLSDSLIPFWGEVLMEMPHAEVHAGFLERPFLINGMALAGIMIAYVRPWTKLPHASHVLLSTWASLFHVIMAHDHAQPTAYFGIFLFLFLAVWLPCCVSDIIFPLLFVKDGEQPPGCTCSCHGPSLK
ncbi:MAG: hypothetical protein ACLFPX_03600 [Candidatus Omnitrophota bacterium]